MAGLVEERGGMAGVVARELDRGGRRRVRLVPEPDARAQDGGAQAPVEVDEGGRRLEAERLQDQVHAVRGQRVQAAQDRRRLRVGAGHERVAEEVQDGLQLEIAGAEPQDLVAHPRKRRVRPEARVEGGRLQRHRVHDRAQPRPQARPQVLLEPGPRRRRGQGVEVLERFHRAAPVRDLGSELRPAGIELSHGATRDGWSWWARRGRR